MSTRLIPLGLCMSAVACASSVPPPRSPVRAAGPRSCVVVTTPGLLGPPRGAHPDQEAVVRHPPEATLTLGGQYADEACLDYIAQRRAEAEESLQGVWVGAWISNDRSGQRTLYDAEASETREWFSLRRLSTPQGAALTLQAPEKLRAERRAYLHLKVLPAAEAVGEEALDDYAEPFDSIRLHVIDTSVLHALSWRSSFALISTPQGVARGIMMAPLLYPARPSAKVHSWLLRDLALEFPLGFANVADPVLGIRSFPYVGLGLTYHEFISAGFVKGLGENGLDGPYVSIALLTRNGVFGYIPYEEIWKAIRQISFSSKSEAPSKPQ